MLRSAFLPTVIGVLLAIDGLAYLCYSFTDILAPEAAAAHLVPWIQLPALIGDGALCVRLLVVGIDVGRWEEQRSAALQLQSTPTGGTAMSHARSPSRAHPSGWPAVSAAPVGLHGKEST